MSCHNMSTIRNLVIARRSCVSGSDQVLHTCTALHTMLCVMLCCTVVIALIPWKHPFRHVTSHFCEPYGSPALTDTHTDTIDRPVQWISNENNRISPVKVKCLRGGGSPTLRGTDLIRRWRPTNRVTGALGDCRMLMENHALRGVAWYAYYWRAAPMAANARNIVSFWLRNSAT